MASVKKIPGDGLGGVIRACRLRRGLNQPQLARLLGVTKNAVTNWESGLTNPNYRIVPDLCRVLDRMKAQ